MTQVHFTLETKEIQSSIEYSVKDYERSGSRFIQRDEKALLASMVEDVCFWRFYS